MSEGPWSPLRLEVHMPVPMLRPTRLRHHEPIPITRELYRALATSAGRIDMDVRWMWRWGSDNLIRFFRSWTGYEIFRFHVRTRDGHTNISSVEVESDPKRYAGGRLDHVIEEMHAALETARTMPDYVQGWPMDRAEALAILLPERERQSANAAASQIQEVLPRRIACVHFAAEGPSAGPNVWLTHAEPDFECVRLTFSDGSLLWLVDPRRVSVNEFGVRAEKTGALFWPAPGSNFCVDAAAWAITRGDQHIVLQCMDHEGEVRTHSPAAPAVGSQPTVNIEFDTGVT